MQKILAILLLIGLINGQDGKTLEERSNEAILQRATEGFEKCSFDDNTECFRSSMKTAEKHTDEATHALAVVADKIIKCKESEDTNECIRKLSETVENKDAQEALQFIANLGQIAAEEKKIEEEIKANIDQFKAENLECIEKEGEEVCDFTQDFKDKIEEENQKFEEEFKEMEKENKKFLEENYTKNEEGNYVGPTEEYKEKIEAEYKKYNKVLEFEDIQIGEETQTIKFTVPTTLAYEEKIKQYEALLVKAKEGEKQFFEDAIKSTQEQMNKAEITKEEVQAMFTHSE
jgi:hypothetical protein